MRSTRPIKQTHRALFLALQADAKEFPGGVTAIAHAMGMNGNTLANGLNPDHEAAPPSFGVIIEIIMLAQAKRSVFAMAQLVNQITVDVEGTEPRGAGEPVKLFLDLMSRLSQVIGTGSAAAQDGRFDADERRMLEPLLMAMVKASVELLASMRA